MMKINVIKGLFLFFIMFFMQAKLTAQIQVGSSAPLINVKFLENSGTSEKQVNPTTNVLQSSKPVYAQSLSSTDSTTVVIPQVFNTEMMDSKPE